MHTTDNDYILGTLASGERVPLLTADRRRHAWICGQTGTGKTGLLLNLMQARFEAVASTLAASPLIGTREHGYETTLYGFVLDPNWVFYRFTDDTIMFLHIRSSLMAKTGQRF